jgi:hydroxypyruvate isomerase
VADIVREIGEPNAKLLFDVYHVQIMEGDLVRRIEKHRDVIGHVQIAGVPDRAEPDDDNEINVRAILRTLDRIGYRGLVGLEYKPRGDTVGGLGWMRDLS